MTEENKEVIDRGDDEEVLEEEVVEQTAEEKVAAEKAEAEKVAAEKVGIPKQRFDEAVKKERDRAQKAEDRAKELEKELKAKDTGLDPAKVEEEIAGLEEDLDKAIADGDANEKKRIRAEIRSKTNALADANAQQRASYATAVAVERVRYDSTVALLETQYPVMNPDDEKFDDYVVAELLELKGAYEAAGMGSSDALKKAAKYVFKTAPAAAKEEPDDEPTAEEKQKAAEAAAKLKEEAIRRGQTLKGKQPADTDKGGKASDKKGGALDEKAVMRMSDKDFAKLDDTEKSRLRGDTI